MKSILLTILAISVLFSGGAHTASIVDNFKNSKPDVSQPAVPPMPIKPDKSSVILGGLPIACMRTDSVIENYVKRGYTKQVLGTNGTGTFELWTGVYEGTNRWVLVVSVNQGLTCMIGGGEVKK